VGEWFKGVLAAQNSPKSGDAVDPAKQPPGCGRNPGQRSDWGVSVLGVRQRQPRSGRITVLSKSRQSASLVVPRRTRWRLKRKRVEAGEPAAPHIHRTMKKAARWSGLFVR